MSLALALILIATAFAATSGIPGLWASRRSAWGERAAATMMVIGATIGLVGTTLGLTVDASVPLNLPLPLLGSHAAMAVDALSAFFLVPIFAMGGLGSIYGLAYWRQASHPTSGRKLRLFWGLLVAGMAVLVLARNAMVFLSGWEVMALSAFFLIGTEDRVPAVRRASWIYLAATHIATLCLFAMFGLLRMAIGSFELKPAGVEQVTLGHLTAIYFLAVIGFGLKAGLIPFHFWLPSAHANAPSHVSAIMSGVLIKTGIYGLLRITSLLPEPPVAWGAILLLLGGLSGVLGVLFAIGQHDLKRLLAYHSVENIGIIVMGLGLAMVGRSLGRIDLVVLGMAGCLLHVWNHGLFKSLLFLSAGSVVHATHTREIDQLGGLVRPMPWTASMFLVGAIAICGLPPLNGFVSELFIYLGLFRSIGGSAGQSWIGAAFAAPLLAMIGALAIVCFVKAYGTVFLGEPRNPATRGAREAPACMIGPMAVIATSCTLIGLAPFAIAPVLDRVVGSWVGPAVGYVMPLSSLVPLLLISVMGGVLLLTVGVVSVCLFRQRLRDASRAGTWACGYAAPAARAQYTASSFVQMLVGLFRWVLRPQTHRPEISGHFCAPARYESRIDDLVLDRQIMPIARATERWLYRLRGLQQGMSQQYVLYILATVIALLVWTAPLDRLIGLLFAR